MPTRVSYYYGANQDLCALIPRVLVYLAKASVTPFTVLERDRHCQHDLIRFLCQVLESYQIGPAVQWHSELASTLSMQ